METSLYWVLAFSPLSIVIMMSNWYEQFHEEAKELLGWDQYQGRRWDGFHRHALLIMIAYSFLVWQEWQQRQRQRRRGRPRGRFSPPA
jgi:SRSO17 transposase